MELTGLSGLQKNCPVERTAIFKTADLVISTTSEKNYAINYNGQSFKLIKVVRLQTLHFGSRCWFMRY